MHPAVTRFLLATVLIGTFASASFAQRPGVANGAVRGEVTDSSGGVLPGVTVEARTPEGRVLESTLTDEVGRFVFPRLPVAAVSLTFRLDGFDEATLSVSVQAGAEASIVQPLSVAQVTEQVVVYGKVPVEPPPLVPLRRPVPVVVPVPYVEMATICVPAKPGAVPELLGSIQSHRYESGRTLYAKGDELLVSVGTVAGLEVGRNLVVRRYYRAGSTAHGDVYGEHTAGLVQIVSADQHVATAVVLHACNELMQGDFLATYTPQPLLPADVLGEPQYGDAIRILYPDASQMMGVARRMMVIDRGADQGIHVGQRVTLFRGEHAARIVIGDAVVVAVRPDSSTIRVERANDAIGLGDWVALQRR
ncbi:MAG: carboxypeptidase-like regulatory domain-containing protein [Acidobacteriota bacterium]